MVQIIAAALGLLIVSVTIWNVVRIGIARSNGKVETWDGINTGRNSDWGGDGFPPA